MGVIAPDGTIIVPPEYERIIPFAITHPGDGVLLLCHTERHRLNGMDVFDINGNCIFKGIGKLFPREETILTPANSEVPLRKIKSLWVVRQIIDRPFPEDPEFQLVQEVAWRYPLQQLRRHSTDEIQQAAMDDQSIWQHCPQPSREALTPLAARISKKINYPVPDILSRLSDYRAFQLERTPLTLRLASVTPHTPLDQLGLSIRTYHCLVRNGLHTVEDLMKVSKETVCRLQRSTDQILQEINVLRQALSERL